VPALVRRPCTPHTAVDPPLPLARLRTRGQVSEIRADALRFVTNEVQFFLHQMDLDLGEEALLSLEERTEGWIAGVQLAALALRGRGDHETFLREFRGTHRFLLEYTGGLKCCIVCREHGKKERHYQGDRCYPYDSRKDESAST
jgi:hypothetical protein